MDDRNDKNKDANSISVKPCRRHSSVINSYPALTISVLSVFSVAKMFSMFFARLGVLCG